MNQEIVSLHLRKKTVLFFQLVRTRPVRTCTIPIVQMNLRIKRHYSEHHLTDTTRIQSAGHHPWTARTEVGHQRPVRCPPHVHNSGLVYVNKTKSFRVLEMQLFTFCLSQDKTFV